MSQASAIEWTDVTWNPVHGCSIVSTECRNCYAQTLSLRYRQTLKPWTPANAAENVILKPHKLREPLSNAKAWRGLGDAAAAAGKTDGQLVFVNSMSDLFHEQIPDEFIDEVFAVMALAERHTFQILTKRPERMRDYLVAASTDERRWQIALRAANRCEDGDATADWTFARPWPLPNVWLGTSIGLRHFIRRADALRETPAAVRFISAEPLLGPLAERMHCGTCWDWPRNDCDECEGLHWWWSMESLDLRDIDWLIVGGESGPDHRPMREEWVQDLRELAMNPANDCAFFFKQWGGARPGGAALLDGREWRQFPTTATEVAHA